MQRLLALAFLVFVASAIRADPPGTVEADVVPEVTSGPADEFRKFLMEHLNKYKGAVEGSPDGRFKELFPTIEKTRAAVKGFTTCVAYQGLAIGYAEQKSGKKLLKTPNVNFFDAQLRRKAGIPPKSFFATVPKGKTLQTVNDPTAQYIDLTDPKSPRPKPGDIFLLAFAHSSVASDGRKLDAGMFSHIGFVTKVVKQSNGIEIWSTVAGGGGNARAKQEAITEGSMKIDTKTQLTDGVANQPGTERRLVGWISLDALLDPNNKGTVAPAAKPSAPGKSQPGKQPSAPQAKTQPGKQPGLPAKKKQNKNGKKKAAKKAPAKIISKATTTPAKPIGKSKIGGTAAAAAGKKF